MTDEGGVVEGAKVHVAFVLEIVVEAAALEESDVLVALEAAELDAEEESEVDAELDTVADADAESELEPDAEIATVFAG